MIKSKPIDSADLKNVLEKYIKSKLPSHLLQKNPTLYTAATSDVSDDDIQCKSLDIQRRLSEDDIMSDDKFNSN